MNNEFDVTRATTVDSQTQEAVADMFAYHQWDDDQKIHGDSVRRALSDAVLVIIQNVPPSPDRSAAIRKIREASFVCNSAITHRGKY